MNNVVNAQEHARAVQAKIAAEAKKNIINAFCTPTVKTRTIDEMTVNELKDLALEKEINLGEAKTKSEILEVIKTTIGE